MTKTVTNNAPRSSWLTRGLILLAMAPALSAQAEDPSLLAHSSGKAPSKDGPLWLVQVEANGAEPKSTVIFNAGDKWQELAKLPARIVAVAGVGTEMVVTLAPGSDGKTTWAWFSTERYSYGPPLPGAVNLGMAGDRGTLWALGLPPLPTTSPATTQAASRTPAPVLFSLGAGQWKAHGAAWPEDLPVRSRDDVSLAIIGEAPCVAVSAGDGHIQILKFEANQWHPIEKVKVDPSPWRHFKLMGIENRPALWVQPMDDAAGGVWMSDVGYHRLALGGTQPKPSDVAVTAVAGQFHVFYRPDKIICQQRFATDGSPIDKPVELKDIRSMRSGMPIDWMAVAVLAVLTILILNTVLRRRSMPRDDDRSDSEE